MAHETDPSVTAASALVGGVATLIQELVAAGAVDPERLRNRLELFVRQDSVQAEAPADRYLIERVIGTLKQAIDFAEEERNENEK